MVIEIIEKISLAVKDLKLAIENDIEDIKSANNQNLMDRNEKKENLIDTITCLKSDLNEELIKKVEEGFDIHVYKDKIDSLEEDLKELYLLNKKLATIVLPIQKMYQDLVEDLSVINGGNAFDIKA